MFKVQNCQLMDPSLGSYQQSNPSSRRQNLSKSDGEHN
jgi:hypothetical protein